MNIGIIKLIFFWGGLFAFLLLELQISYRPATFDKLKRWLTNMSLSITNGVIFGLLFQLFLFALLPILYDQAGNQSLGLMNISQWPFLPGFIISLLLIDLYFYVMHVLYHKIPILWRLHRVHHSDLNMDASTAHRFHFGEILFTGLLRVFIIYLLGINLAVYVIYEILMNLAIQFHHRSIRINRSFEKAWILLFVPPSMHRIHHSVIIKERDSNYGVLFSIWDRLLRTLTMNVDQKKIIIGLGSHRDFAKLGFRDIWRMPFTSKSI
jgi:sterol desaturase/sphingolipid hydroxylase (fatty acid hydroxylase superfamily)